MRLHIRALLLSCLALAAHSAMAGTTAVSLVNASSYTDVGLDSIERGFNLQTLTRHLEMLGQRYLPPNQVLKIEIQDVDMAGRERPSRHHGYVRFTTASTDWPRINLQYTLEADGKVIRSGREVVTDLDYAHRISRYRTERMHYEKAMLDAWFKARFVEQRAAVN